MGGFGSAVAEWLASNGIERKLTMLGIPDEFVKQGTVAQLQHLCGIDAEGIAEAVKHAINS